jgi:anaerobic dimethyl sulfoxide reductase subunit C (anchor subunit)
MQPKLGMKKRFDMQNKEWTLVFFSTLVQMAVGFFLFLMGYHLLWQSRDPFFEPNLVRSGLLWIITLLVVGVLAAFLHLGRPLRAIWAITNLRSSWLSREMLLGLLFGFFTLIYVVMVWFGTTPSTIRNIVGLLAALCGVGLVYVMSRLYMLRTVPAWNVLATPVSFIITTLLLGTMTAGTLAAVGCSPILNTDQACPSMSGGLGWMGITTFVLVLLQILVNAGDLVYLSTQGGAATVSVQTLLTQYRNVFLIRIFLYLVGITLLIIFSFNATMHTEWDAVSTILLLIAFGVVFVAEVMGRYLFYRYYKREGI